jgi:hypothetical protein
MVMDLVTRTWICELVSAEETGLQVGLAFTHALELKGACSTGSTRTTRSWPTRPSTTRLGPCSWPSATPGRG